MMNVLGEAVIALLDQKADVGILVRMKRLDEARSALRPEPFRVAGKIAVQVNDMGQLRLETTTILEEVEIRALIKYLEGLL
jgi:hypothetical protein